MPFDDYESTRRKRPLQVCSKCGKTKEGRMHDEDGNLLCPRCYSQYKRLESPAAVQERLTGLVHTLIKTVRKLSELPSGDEAWYLEIEAKAKLNLRKYLGDQSTGLDDPEPTEE